MRMIWDIVIHIQIALCMHLTHSKQRRKKSEKKTNELQLLSVCKDMVHAVYVEYTYSTYIVIAGYNLLFLLFHLCSRSLNVTQLLAIIVHFFLPLVYVCVCHFFFVAIERISELDGGGDIWSDAYPCNMESPQSQIVHPLISNSLSLIRFSVSIDDKNEVLWYLRARVCVCVVGCLDDEHRKWSHHP